MYSLTFTACNLCEYFQINPPVNYTLRLKEHALVQQLKEKWNETEK